MPRKLTQDVTIKTPSTQGTPGGAPTVVINKPNTVVVNVNVNGTQETWASKQSPLSLLDANGVQLDPVRQANQAQALRTFVDQTANAWGSKLAEAQVPSEVRPVGAAVGKLLDGTFDVAAEVQRMTGQTVKQLGKHKVLLLASESGVWASELTVVASTLKKAGYEVQIGTESGRPPHILSVSGDPTFNDGSWKGSVVSPEEAALAKLYLTPGTDEYKLINENIFDLSTLPKPPLVGEYQGRGDPPKSGDQLMAEYQEELKQKLGEVVGNTDALILAGGSGAVSGFTFDRGLRAMIGAFDALNKPIMAECNGGLAVAQTINPDTGKSILEGRAVTTHSTIDEYGKGGWGWTNPDEAAKGNEVWVTPGSGNGNAGNPIIESQPLFENAIGPKGEFFSPGGSDYAVVADNNLITCRTTPDGMPGALALIARLDGGLSGRLFIDKDELGRKDASALSDRKNPAALTPNQQQQLIGAYVDKVANNWEGKLAEAQVPSDTRPVGEAAGKLLDGTLDVAAEIKRITGAEVEKLGGKKVLVLASEAGVWASELTVVVSTLKKAGYEVQVGTESGRPPHILSVSTDPAFKDGSWKGPVVSEEEAQLAKLYLTPGTDEYKLINENIFDLSRLPKPPLVGEYQGRGDPPKSGEQVMAEYKEALAKELGDVVMNTDGLVIAGGSGAVSGFTFDRGLRSMIGAFNALNKPIMAECNGGLPVAQTIDPATGQSILRGRAVTTHSTIDEYGKGGWGWTNADEAAKGNEVWVTPGSGNGNGGNPILESEQLFKDAIGPRGEFFSPGGTDYAAVADGNLITCRTTPDGYPGVLMLMARMEGKLEGRLFVDRDEPGRRTAAAE